MAASLRLPCLSCKKPEAEDVKHALGQGAFDEVRNMTPSGLPVMCCRVVFAGVAPATDRLGNSEQFLAAKW
jgi:hypothetical protein